MKLMTGRTGSVSALSLLVLLGTMTGLRAEQSGIRFARSKGGGPPQRLGRADKKLPVGSSVAHSHELLLACEDETLLGGCDMIPVDDTSAIAGCLVEVRPMTARCRSQLFGAFRTLHKPLTAPSMMMLESIGEEPSDSSFRFASLPPVEARPMKKGVSDWPDAMDSSDSADSSSDSADSSSDSVDILTESLYIRATSSEDSSDSSEFPPPLVRSQGVRLKKLQPKDARVFSPPSAGSRSTDRAGLRKSHGLRGTGGGSESHEHGPRGHHGNFEHPSEVQFNGRYPTTDGHQQHRSAHHSQRRQKNNHYCVFAFLGVCLLAQVMLPVILWRRRVGRESGAATATATATTTATTSGDYQAVPLMNSDGAAVADDDDAVVVTGMPVNPPPSAHV